MPDPKSNEIQDFQIRLKRFQEIKSKFTKDNEIDWNEIAEDTKPEEKFPNISAKQLIAKQFPQTVWLVENLIPAEGFTALTGTPASYKSFITEHLAVCLGTNKPFLGHFQVFPGAVLIIDKENPLSLIKERLQKLGINKEDPPIYFLADPDHYKLFNDEQLKDTIEFIKEKQIKLVILDSFVHIHKGDENDSGAIAQTFERLKLLSCAVLFIHHHRKTIKFFTGTPLESIRGSSDIGAEVESHIALDIVPTGLRMSQHKNRRGQLIKPFLVTPLITEDQIIFEYGGEIEDEVTKVEAAIQVILNLFTTKKEISRKEIVQGLSDNFSRATIDRTVKEMEEKNMIKSHFIDRSKWFVDNTQDDVSLSNVEISPTQQSYLEESE